MGLADEIQHSDTPQDLTSGPIPIHTWTAAWELYARGEATANQIKNIFGIESRGCETGMYQLQTQIDDLSTENQKLLHVMKMEAAGLFYENGSIDKTKYKEIMGLTDNGD